MEFMGYTLYSSPAVANGVVYVGSWDGNVYALDAKTGAKLWSYDAQYGVESSPAVTNGVLYIGASNGYMYAFVLPRSDEARQDSSSKRPDSKTFLSDFSLKLSKPTATPSGAER